MHRMLVTIATIVIVGLFSHFAAAADSQPIDPVSAEDLRKTCDSEGGQFYTIEGGGYGCTKDDCDGKGGTCGVQCSESKNITQCYGITPVVSQGRLPQDFLSFGQTTSPSSPSKLTIQNTNKLTVTPN